MDRTTLPEILVIDDDPAMREIFDILLRRAALAVKSAGTVSEARASAATGADLILLDLHLGAFDGVELARELASSLKQTPIIAISASSESSVQERARNAGCIGFVSKPINPRTFATEVMQYWRNSAVPHLSEASETETIALQLRREFLDGALQTFGVLAARRNDQMFSDTLMTDAAHRWIGASGIGGIPDVQQMAHEIETLATLKPSDAANRVREVLLSLESEFRKARQSITA